MFYILQQPAIPAAGTVAAHSHQTRHVSFQRTFISFVLAVLLALHASFTISFFVTPEQAHADELSNAAAALEEAKGKAESAQSAKDEADAAVAATEVAIAEIEAVLPEQQAKTEQVIKEIYMNGGESGMEMSFIDIILSADSFSEMIRSIDAWYTIMLYRQAIVDQSNESKRQLEEDKTRLIEEQKTAQAALDETNQAKSAAQSAYDKARRAAQSVPKSANVDWSSASEGGILTLSQMKFRGVVNYAGYRYTYYSQSVLPGGGLRIPGRHVEKGCVVDEDGYICVASSTHPKGTIVPTPLVEFPKGKVYDSGCAYGTIDLYIA